MSNGQSLELAALCQRRSCQLVEDSRGLGCPQDDLAPVAHGDSADRLSEWPDTARGFDDLPLIRGAESERFRSDWCFLGMQQR